MLELYRKNYKRLIVIVSILLIFVFTMSGCKSKVVEGVVAEVNNEGITEEEFQREFQIYRGDYERQYGEDIMSQVVENGETLEDALKSQVIEMLILHKLILKEASDMGIVVTDEEIKTRIDQLIEEVGGEEQFEQYLEENEFSREMIEENLKKEMIISRHVEAFKEEIDIPEKESKKYFEENKEELEIVKVSHILVEKEEEEKGKEILKRLKNGEDFANLALMESRDLLTAENGGSFGYFRKGTLPVEFEEVAFSLEPGEISELIKTEVGYQIIYLEDRKDTYEDLEDEILHIMKDQKYSEKIHELRNNAKVKFYGELDKKE